MLVVDLMPRIKKRVVCEIAELKGIIVMRSFHERNGCKHSIDVKLITRNRTMKQERRHTSSYLSLLDFFLFFFLFYSSWLLCYRFTLHSFRVAFCDLVYHWRSNRRKCVDKRSLLRERQEYSTSLELRIQFLANHFARWKERYNQERDWRRTVRYYCDFENLWQPSTLGVSICSINTKWVL